MSPATPAETAVSDLREDGTEWHRYLGYYFFAKPSRQASKEFRGKNGHVYFRDTLFARSDCL